MPAVALLDANNFYASCERLFDARLHNKPVVVLSNNDGCVIARSNEAKALGITMGAPFFKVQDLIDAHGVKVYSSNYTLYGVMWNQKARMKLDYEPAVAPLDFFATDERNVSGAKVAPQHAA